MSRRYLPGSGRRMSIRMLAAAFVCAMIAGCQTAASPPIAVEKNVYVLVIGDSNVVRVDYEQWSESALDLQDLLIRQQLDPETELSVPLVP